MKWIQYNTKAQTSNIDCNDVNNRNKIIQNGNDAKMRIKIFI